MVNPLLLAVLVFWKRPVYLVGSDFLAADETLHAVDPCKSVGSGRSGDVEELVLGFFDLALPLFLEVGNC
jgi:hypothetical protein